MDKLAVFIDAVIEKRAQERAIEMLQELQKIAAIPNILRTQVQPKKSTGKNLLKILALLGLAGGAATGGQFFGDVLTDQRHMSEANNFWGG